MNRIGPVTTTRYAVGTVGATYANKAWRQSTITSVRKQHGRLKLTVSFTDGTPTTEVTLNLYRENGLLVN